MRNAVFLRNLCLGLFILTGPMIWCPASVAQDEQPLDDPSVEVLYDDGEHGVARAPLPEDLDLASYNNSRRRTEVTVFAAYTSDRGTLTSPLAVNGRVGDTYWQWLCPWAVYLYVSFTVDQPCYVTVTWAVGGVRRPRIKNSMDTSGLIPPVLCLPGTLYFAWWELSFLEDVPEGDYRVVATVKPNVRKAKKDSDLCKFRVVSCAVPYL